MTVPLPVGVYDVVAGKVGVKVAVASTGLPFASVVVYVYGVGPPGLNGVVPGWPTGPCWTCVVVAAAAADADVVEADVAAVAAVVAAVEAWEAAVVVAAAPPMVCLKPMQSKER